MKKATTLFLCVLMLLSFFITASAEEWICESCGNNASGNFCSNCGAAKPTDEWNCPQCGNAATGNFCSSCGSPKPTTTSRTANIDFENDTGFEEALNSNEMVVGKVVRFKAKSVHPDSFLGFNIWSGEHLNFVSENPVDVEAGDIVIARITDVDTIMGSWKLSYEIIEVQHESAPAQDSAQIEDETVPQDDATSEYRVLDLNDKGEDVERLKQRLIDLGYATGSPKGFYGLATQDAIRRFQEDAGLPVTGIADEQTQEALFTKDITAQPTIESTPTPAPVPENQTLKNGDTGNAVKKMQKRLIKLGYLNKTTIDGNYGDAETAAVKDFQAASGLEVTGIADETTLDKLYSSKAVKASNYGTLKKGDKGEAVKKLQLRLKDLNFLDGSADGDYGNKTKDAVARFQSAAGLEKTGIADNETQKALYSDNAPKAKTYNKLNYNAVARDPSAHKGELIYFQGKIVQVMESGNIAVFRIATKGNYDDVVYCTYITPSNYKRFLEDDKVTVYGTCTGVYSYEAVMGNTITIPSCDIETITLR